MSFHGHDVFRSVPYYLVLFLGLALARIIFIIHPLSHFFLVEALSYRFPPPWLCVCLNKISLVFAAHQKASLQRTRRLRADTHTL